MLNIIYSARASDDLDDIRSYISTDNEYYADKVVETIFAFANNLATFPMMGKEISVTGQLREIVEPVFRYRIIYKFDGSDLLVIAILKYKSL